ncbi:hypothetical protein FKM82_012392 [Ascaphus truei]
MGSPKKPQRLQLSSPESVKDNISLPEKRSPISSRIWQEEDPTRKSGFSGEDLSMRNFCVSVQGDNDVMEGSFSFDTDGDSILGTQSGRSMDTLKTLPVHETKGMEEELKHKDMNTDVNKKDISESERHGYKSTDTASVICGGIETSQKDITGVKDLLECKGKTDSSEAKQDTSITPVNLQPNTVSNKGVTQERNSCESIQSDSKVIHFGKPHQESLLAGINSDTFNASSSDLKNERLHDETEKAKGKITKESHVLETDDTAHKPPVPEPSTVPSKVPSATGPTTNETSKLMQESPAYSLEEKSLQLKEKSTTDSSLKSEVDSSLDMSKGRGHEGQIRSEGALRDVPIEDNENKKINGKSEFSQGAEANVPVHEIKIESSAKGQIGGKETANGDHLTKTYSFKLTPAIQAIGTQADNRVEFRSIAISPIIPPEACSSFTFQTGMGTAETSSVTNSCKRKAGQKESKEDLPKTYSFELTPPNQDVVTKTGVQYRSVAVSPIIPPDGSSSFTFKTEHSSQARNNQKGSTTDQRMDTGTIDNLPKSYSFELTPPNQDVGTETRVECKSAAVSPIIPPDGSSFTFQTLKSSSSATAGEQETRSVHSFSKTYSSELTTPNQNVGTQADTRAECVSVAVSPIIPPGESSSFIFHTEQRCQELPGKSSAQEKESTPQDVGIQADTRVQCISVAVSPIVPPAGSSTFTFLTEKAALGSTLKSSASDQKRDKDDKSIDNLPKTYSFELTPPNDDAATDTRVEYKSVAVSPIILSDESLFTFQTEKKKGALSAVKGSSIGHEVKKEATTVDLLPKTYSFELTPPSQDVGIQADNRVECVSVAVSPIILPQESSSFTFQAEQKHHESLSKHQDLTGEQEPRSTCALPKTYSCELTPHNQDVGTQADSRAQCTSVAVSPIIPLDGSSSFLFHTEGTTLGPPYSTCSHVVEKPSMKDAEMQVSFPVETRSVATDPMTPVGKSIPAGKSPRASYPEVRVKEGKGEHPEPVREVSWDEKGMTWEVYGASMEVEVLGMAIQKHLEKQIEEHGRQKVLSPQNTRGTSIRSAPGKAEGKQQPSVFRTFFHSVRRPRCCSRAGPAME